MKDKITTLSILANKGFEQDFKFDFDFQKSIFLISPSIYYPDLTTILPPQKLVNLTEGYELEYPQPNFFSEFTYTFFGKKQRLLVSSLNGMWKGETPKRNTGDLDYYTKTVGNATINYQPIVEGGEEYYCIQAGIVGQSGYGIMKPATTYDNLHMITPNTIGWFYRIVMVLTGGTTRDCNFNFNCGFTYTTVADTSHGDLIVRVMYDYQRDKYTLYLYYRRNREAPFTIYTLADLIRPNTSEELRVWFLVLNKKIYLTVDGWNFNASYLFFFGETTDSVKFVRPIVSSYYGGGSEPTKLFIKEFIWRGVVSHCFSNQTDDTKLTINLFKTPQNGWNNINNSTYRFFSKNNDVFLSLNNFKVYLEADFFDTTINADGEQFSLILCDRFNNKALKFVFTFSPNINHFVVYKKTKIILQGTKLDNNTCQVYYKILTNDYQNIYEGTINVNYISIPSYQTADFFIITSEQPSTLFNKHFFTIELYHIILEVKALEIKDIISLSINKRRDYKLQQAIVGEANIVLVNEKVDLQPMDKIRLSILIDNVKYIVFSGLVDRITFDYITKTISVKLRDMMKLFTKRKITLKQMLNKSVRYIIDRISDYCEIPERLYDNNLTTIKYANIYDADGIALLRDIIQAGLTGDIFCQNDGTIRYINTAPQVIINEVWDTDSDFNSKAQKFIALLIQEGKLLQDTSFFYGNTQQRYDESSWVYQELPPLEVFSETVGDENLSDLYFNYGDLYMRGIKIKTSLYPIVFEWRPLQEPDGCIEWDTYIARAGIISIVITEYGIKDLNTGNTYTLISDHSIPVNDTGEETTGSNLCSEPELPPISRHPQVEGTVLLSTPFLVNFSTFETYLRFYIPCNIEFSYNYPYYAWWISCHETEVLNSYVDGNVEAGGHFFGNYPHQPQISVYGKYISKSFFMNGCNNWLPMEIIKHNARIDVYVRRIGQTEFIKYSNIDNGFVIPYTDIEEVYWIGYLLSDDAYIDKVKFSYNIGGQYQPEIKDTITLDMIKTIKIITTDEVGGSNFLINKCEVSSIPKTVSPTLEEVWIGTVNGEPISNTNKLIITTIPSVIIAELNDEVDEESIQLDIITTCSYTFEKHFKKPKITFTSTGEVSKLRILAKRLIEDTKIISISEDIDSINAYGESLEKIDNDFISYPEIAKSLADIIVNTYKRPAIIFELETILLPHLELNDLVNLQLTRDETITCRILELFHNVNITSRGAEASTRLKLIKIE